MPLIGLPRLPPHRPLLGAERDEIGRLLAMYYGAGWSITALAQRLGRGRITVWRLLHERGVPMRPRGGNHRQP